MKKIIFTSIVYSMLMTGATAGMVDTFMDACEKGDMQGCYQAGVSYWQGDGTSKDTQAARSLLQISCDGGFDDACVTLQTINIEDSGVEYMERKTLSNSPDKSNFVGHKDKKLQSDIDQKYDSSSPIQKKSNSVGSYALPITRNGVTHHMVAYNYWSGEYPKPVINVKYNQNKWVAIKGYVSLRKPVKRKVCSIKTGIYHPWSKDKISLINYYSIIPKIDYVAEKNTILDGQKIKKGDKLSNEVYIAEGNCSYLLNKKKQITTVCVEDSLGDPLMFKRIKHPSHSPEQWLYLNCREGYKVFVQDVDLLRQPNVSKGVISGYGSVTAIK